MPTRLSLCIVVHNPNKDEVKVLPPVSLVVKPENPPSTPQFKTEKTIHPEYGDQAVTILIQYWEHSTFVTNQDLQTLVLATYRLRLSHFPK
jgi:hypothetical protein